MRSEIHAAVPLWINTPLEPPLPSGSPVTERWRLVQKHLPPLAELLDVEIVIMNAEGYCVGGTGPYLRGVGFRMPADNALTYSLRSGQSSMVLTPGKEEVCRTCSGKGACADVANFTGPVVIENEIVAVVQIVAFTDNQRAELLMKSEKAFELISQIIGFAWARGRDVESLPEQPRDDRFPSIIGESKAILRLKAAILKAAGTNATVLIQGESGTGKELIAQAVHDNSPRHTGPFVAINCGAIPESLFESELFGYKKGAFTGATADKKGYLDQADGGTLFLDELGEISLMGQVKLLRAIEHGGFTPVGGAQIHRPDVRIIAATNRDLLERVNEGAMRRDFYYRIHVIPIHLPPLRQRKEDIPLLIEYFLNAYPRVGDLPALNGEVMQAFMQYDWPGNIRELHNTLYRYLTLGKVQLGTLQVGSGQLPAGGQTGTGEAEHRQALPQEPLASALDRFEREYLLETLRRNDWKRAETADILGIDRRTLFRKIKQFDLEDEEGK